MKRLLQKAFLMLLIPNTAPAPDANGAGCFCVGRVLFLRGRSIEREGNKEGSKTKKRNAPQDALLFFCINYSTMSVFPVISFGWGSPMS